VTNGSLTTSIEPRFRTLDGVNVRYADSGGSHDTTLLLTSASSVVRDRPARVRCVRTTRRPADAACDGRVLGQGIAEADIGTPHVVAPDVGTSAALFAAASHPERIAGAIVGTGGAAVPLELGEPLRSWVLDPDLGKYRAIDPHVIVNAAIDTVAGGVPDDSRADYLASYEGDRFVESMQYVRSYPEQLPALAELLPEIATPVTIINGRHDRVVPVANAEFLAARLPNSRVVLLDHGHFVWEEAPAEYAAAILDSLDRKD